MHSGLSAVHSVQHRTSGQEMMGRLKVEMMDDHGPPRGALDNRVKLGRIIRVKMLS